MADENIPGGADLRLDPGMPAEVMKDFDTVLLFGILAGLVPLTLRALPEGPAFPVLEAGGIVLVRCYDRGMTPLMLRARVLRSSPGECAFRDLKPIAYRSARQRTRFPLCPPAKARLLLKEARSCWLINLSTGGACVVSECACQCGQRLLLQLALEGPSPDQDYACEVVRVTPRRDRWREYGLRFAGLSPLQRARLEQALLAIHRKWAGA